ncbi:Protein tilB-like protein [Hypsibius exemplaris]|uniref:Protein tilB-like protein n=1 Tax=Hypsibius exemplaris TaxID=2072580 RepID=A0A9X6RNL9_HYPEX|nr:Protein tilB-like protein [Hypsibius exemplaris]
MSRITLDLLRRRCEHNEGLIHNLEELSLHQDNLEEIENIDRWCKDLKILYLQGNSIPKIENLSRLKDLEYLNLALNGIERIENLQGCESLRKLDLTANFIGDLTSVESLRENPYLEELAEFDGYRSYVIAALPHLRILDGQEVTRTEQLEALHFYLDTKAKIIRQQVAYKAKRDLEKEKNAAKLVAAPCHSDGDGGSGKGTHHEWEKLSWSPEYRREMHRHRVGEAAQKDPSKSHTSLLHPNRAAKRDVVLAGPTGEVLNVNEARLEYTLKEDDEEENNEIVLDVSVYRHLDSSLVDVDVNPTFVKVTVKGKVLQLKLGKEVAPDKSTIQRSRTSGHLLIHMPLADSHVKATPMKKPAALEGRQLRSSLPCSAAPPRRVEKLEVDPALKSKVNLDFVTSQGLSCRQSGGDGRLPGRDVVIVDRANSPGFMDDSEVPPLI